MVNRPSPRGRSALLARSRGRERGRQQGAVRPEGHAVIRRGKARHVYLEELHAADRAEIIAEYLRAGLNRSGAKANAKQARYTSA
jgi:hypothetical protein